MKNNTNHTFVCSLYRVGTLYFSQSAYTVSVQDSLRQIEKMAVPSLRGHANSSDASTTYYLSITSFSESTTMCSHSSLKWSNHRSCCSNSPLTRRCRRRRWQRAHRETGLPSNLIVHYWPLFYLGYGKGLSVGVLS